jgi:YVTN family beta-propeller protein
VTSAPGRRRTLGLTVAAVATGLVAALAIGPGAAADTVTATIAVGTTPRVVAVSPDGGQVWSTEDGSNTVSVIDTATDTVIDAIPGIINPWGIVFDPDGTRVFVAEAGPGTFRIAVIDVATRTITDSVTGLPSYPTMLAISPDGSTLYAATESSSTITVIDVATLTVVGPVTGISGNVYGMAVSSDGSRLYAVRYIADDLAVVDTATDAVIGAIAVGDFPREVALSPDGTRAYVTDLADDTISIVDLGANTSSPVPAAPVVNPAGVAVSPDGTRVYVTGAGNATLGAFDADGVFITSTTVGTSPQNVAITPDGGRAYVSNQSSSSVSVVQIETDPVFTVASLPNGAVGEAYSATVAAAGQPAPTFSVSAGALPPGLALDPTTGAITGTPTSAGAFAFTIEAANSSGTATQSYTITILATLPATGVDPEPLLITALGLLVLGTGALILARRPRGRRAH